MQHWCRWGIKVLLQDWGWLAVNPLSEITDVVRQSDSRPSSKRPSVFATEPFGVQTSQFQANKTLPLPAKGHRVGSRFATFRFTTIHFYDACRVGQSTPDLCCVTVATQISARLPLFRFAYVSFKLIVIFPLMTSNKKTEKKKKIKTFGVIFFLDVFWTTVWGFFDKNKKRFDYLCYFLYT